MCCSQKIKPFKQYQKKKTQCTTYFENHLATLSLYFLIDSSRTFCTVRCNRRGRKRRISYTWPLLCDYIPNNRCLLELPNYIAAESSNKSNHSDSSLWYAWQAVVGTQHSVDAVAFQHWRGVLDLRFHTFHSSDSKAARCSNDVYRFPSQIFVPIRIGPFDFR